MRESGKDYERKERKEKEDRMVIRDERKKIRMEQKEVKYLRCLIFLGASFCSRDCIFCYYIFVFFTFIEIKIQLSLLYSRRKLIE